MTICSRLIRRYRTKYKTLSPGDNKEFKRIRQKVKREETKSTQKFQNNFFRGKTK